MNMAIKVVKDFMSRFEDRISLIKHIVSHKLAQGTVIYTVSMGLNAAISIILMPILTRYLTPSDYGILSILNVLLSVLTIVISMQASTLLGVRYFKSEKSDYFLLLGNIFYVFLICFVFTFFGTVLFRHGLASRLSVPVFWIVLIPLIALINAIFQTLLSIWQFEEKPIFYGLFLLAISLINISLSIFLVVHSGLSWQGRMLGIFLSILLAGLFSIYVLLKKSICFQFSFKHIREVFVFCLPLLVYVLNYWVMTATDRLFLTYFLGNEATGIYTAGYQIAFILPLITSAFNQAWSPFLFRKLSQKDPAIDLMVVKFTYCAFIVLISSFVLMNLFSSSIIKVLLGPNFYRAKETMFWLSIASVSTSMYYIIAGYICYAEKTGYLTAISTFTALLNFVLNFVLIKINGLIGVAQATAFSSLVFFGLTWLAAQRSHKMPWGFFLRRSCS